MTDQAAQPTYAPEDMGARVREGARTITGYWGAWLAAGIAWLVAALVILQFDSASVTTVGIIVGLLFTLAGVESLAVAGVMPSGRWLPATFGVLFLISGVICFVAPEKTFAGMADMLGFLFLIVAISWMVRAFIERAVNPTWGVDLIAGVLMTGVAFWTAGQFFVEKAYVLLVFAGLWALMKGVTDIVRAFEIRRVHDALDHPNDVTTTHPVGMEAA